MRSVLKLLIILLLPGGLVALIVLSSLNRWLRNSRGGFLVKYLRRVSKAPEFESSNEPSIRKKEGSYE